MATGITFGTASQPSQVTKNFDALISTSLENYRKTLYDAISTSNAFFYKLKTTGAWEGMDGGLYIAVDLMYELGSFDAYDGYDELRDDPMDGITQAQFQWRQGAVPITYSEKERKQNKHRVINLIESKLKQAEMGFTEGFNKAFLQGALPQGGALTTPFTSPYNGSYFIDPLPLMVHNSPADSVEIGNINQNTSTWWRNFHDESAATTYDALLLEFDKMYDLCSRGPGGEPDLILMDEVTKQLLNFAYFQRFRTNLTRDGNFPFDNLMFRSAHIVWDQYVPDVYNDAVNCDTNGTAYFLNTKFFNVVYESETNFTRTEFARPPKGDSRLAYILWMGQVTMNNRRKHGVIDKIARTLT